MKIGEQVSHQYAIYGDQLNGQTLYKVDEFNDGKTSDDRVLVKNQDGQWTPVDTIDKGISSAELKENYGLWQDKRRIRDLFKKDGKVQNDEVTPFSKELKTKQCEGCDPIDPYFAAGYWINYYSSSRDAQVNVEDGAEGKKLVLATDAVIDSESVVSFNIAHYPGMKY